MKKHSLIFSGSLLIIALGILSLTNQPVKPATTRHVTEDKKRKISVAEYQFALSIFEREFPPRDIITITNFTGLGNSFYVRPTIDGDIRVNMGQYYDNLLESNVSKAYFAHELTHVWQLVHFGKLWFAGEAICNQIVRRDILSTNPYQYTCDSTKKLDDYNAEQQGDIVKNYFLGDPCASNIARRVFASKTWKLLIGSDGRDAATDETGNYWLVNSEGKIYRYGVDEWQQMPGSDGRAIAANGGKIGLVNTAGKIYSMVNDAWQQMPGSDAKDIAIDSDGSFWLVNTAGKIYKYNGSSWIQMPGRDAVNISAGGGQVWMVNTVGKIYQFKDSKWSQMAGSDGKDITVTNDGKVFLTNNVGKIYQWNGKLGSAWTQLDGSDGVRVSANKGKLILINTSGRLYDRAY